MKYTFYHLGIYIQWREILTNFTPKGECRVMGDEDTETLCRNVGPCLRLVSYSKLSKKSILFLFYSLGQVHFGLTPFSNNIFPPYTWICLYIVKPFNLRFINYLEDEHLKLFSFPTSSVSRRFCHKLHLLSYWKRGYGPLGPHPESATDCIVTSCIPYLRGDSIHFYTIIILVSGRNSLFVVIRFHSFL